MTDAGFDPGDRPNLRKFSVYDDLIIHIVPRNQQRYFQVRRVVPGVGVRTIIEAGQKIGTGTDKTELGVVHGNY